MATVAQPVERVARRPARRTRSRSWIAGGVVWIVAIAVLLAGVVAVNVAVLQQNVRLDHLDSERVDLKAQIAVLSSQLSSTEAAPRIQELARVRLGLVPADATVTKFIDLRPRRG
jgi:cell division protein FtsL